MNRDFIYTTDPDFDYTIDEKGNTFIALRKIDWGNKGEYKLDLRKYYASESGETMSKGVSFLTDDGPDELTDVLVRNDYGHDDSLAEAIIECRPSVLARIKYKLDNDPDLSAKIAEDEAYGGYDEDGYYNPEELMG